MPADLRWAAASPNFQDVVSTVPAAYSMVSRDGDAKGSGHVVRMSQEHTPSGVEGDLKKIKRVGRGKRDVILAAALVVVGIVIGAVWFGFRGSHVLQSSAAMTAPVPPSGAAVVPRATTQ